MARLAATSALLLVVLCAPSSSWGDTCLYPPCPQDDAAAQQQQELPVGGGDKCCSGNSQEIEAIHRNLSALWYTVSEFREVVARHLHHLHEHQVLMFGHQMTGSQPPLHSHQQPVPANDSGSSSHQDSYSRRRSKSKSSSRGRPYRRPSTYRGHRTDPFHGLDKAPVPTAFTRLPTVRNPEEFDLAICQMRPNSALPESQAHGQILFAQKKDSDILLMHVMLSGLRAPGPRLPVPSLDGPQVQGQKHGLHVHEKADFSNGCDSTGPHYNPQHQTHGGPQSTVRHIGDFGNVISDHEGSINELIFDQVASLRGQFPILGKPLVIHAQQDDLGSNPNDPGSTSTGNSGPRLACCVIEKVQDGVEPPVLQVEAPLLLGQRQEDEYDEQESIAAHLDEALADRQQFV